MEKNAKEEIENANFQLIEKHVEDLVHDDSYTEKGEILNFKKFC
jgi:hypothetical protein